MTFLEAIKCLEGSWKTWPLTYSPSHISKTTKMKISWQSRIKIEESFILPKIRGEKIKNFLVIWSWCGLLLGFLLCLSLMKFTNMLGENQNHQMNWVYFLSKTLFYGVDTELFCAKYVLNLKSDKYRMLKSQSINELNSMGLVTSCHCAIVGILLIQSFSLWAFCRSKMLPHRYFMGPKFFAVVVF